MLCGEESKTRRAVGGEVQLPAAVKVEKGPDLGRPHLKRRTFGATSPNTNTMRVFFRHHHAASACTRAARNKRKRRDPRG